VFTWIVLFLAGIFAGAQNSLAGGGSFVTLGMLVVAGLDPRAANITSTIALFPGQVASGYTGRHMVAGINRLSFRALFIISLAGGIAGALLLLATPPRFFAGLVPWLVLFATAVFYWGSFVREPSDQGPVMAANTAGIAQFLIAVYGGYFGGGIGFMMMAVLTIAGMPVLRAAMSKNVLAAAMNASAVAIFLLSRDVYWLHAAVLGSGGIVGGVAGARLLPRINERTLRIGVIALGIALTIGLFLRAR
jgi:uncharacterized protein